MIFLKADLQRYRQSCEVYMASSEAFELARNELEQLGENLD